MKRRDLIKLSAMGLLAVPGISLAARVPAVPRLQLELRPEQRHWFVSGGAPSDGAPVALWGSNLDLLRLRQHQPVEIEVINNLPDETTLHWHGIRVDNAMDGVSGLTQAPIPPRGRFVYRLTPPDAGTFWAHAHHRTYEQLARGLYLPLIVDEAEPYTADRDQLLVLDDWRLGKDGQLDTDSLGDMHEWAHGGRMGNILTVNRQHRPQLKARAGERVRLRVLNAANARIMVLQLPDWPIWILAKDGQPLSAPREHAGPLVLSPAERYDLLLDIPPNGEGSHSIYHLANESQIEIARLLVDAQAAPLVRSAPVPLAANPLPALPARAPDHRLQLDMTGGAMGSLRQAVYRGQMLNIDELVQQRQIWAFNGSAGLAEQPLLRARPGELVEIELHNNTRWPHGMHLHGHHFQAESARYPSDLWHDTLLMARGDRVPIRFVAGTQGRWLLHCHMIEHQAAGMVSWIDIVV
ncbi:multicopper oxidase family protein [Marinobacterium rhizophilum]|uniref:multicopper oxidase family protein n=1 Tax=Marinobacterium rhizophilum TaxID=420402 RepID=UPI0003A1A3DE|nr:multicopper oxidase family protein [Marinobacterium rhizophilum]